MNRYLSGFANEHASEALPGTLPEGQNAPQRHPRGLYTEQISGTPFTAPRGENRRSWLYRIRPSAAHPAYRRIENGLLRGTPFDEAEPPPNRLRWNPLPFPDIPADFIDGLVTMGGNGDAGLRSGISSPRLPCDQGYGSPRVLRCGRRIADRAAGRSALAHDRVR